MKISKNMSNQEIAELLRDIAAAYQICNQEKNKFRIIAYENAAAAVEHLSSEAKDLYDEGKLKDVGGIGPSIATHLGEIFETGKSKHFAKVMSGIPPAVFELTRLPGIGPKTAAKLVRLLKIGDRDAIAELKKAAATGKIRELEGFGEESEKKIIKTIDEVKPKTKRLLYPYALERAQEIIDWMNKCKDVQKIDVLGSLRRKVSTIGDVDISVASDKPSSVLEHFVAFKKKTRVIERGDRTASLKLPGGVQIDIMVQPPESYGSLLQHFTGSKHHNIALREYALKKGLSLSEYGVKKGGVLKRFSDEEEFYRYLGLDYIPPELREDVGEIEAAQEGRLPKLVEIEDIKGDFQVHSDFNIETSHDLGISTMEELLDRAQSLGYEYLAFTEHNPSQRGHKTKDVVDLLKRKREKIEQLRSPVKAFNSLEIDILPGGGISVPNEGLEILDFALVSIHSSFQQSRSEMTKRVLDALSYPKVKIFAHPTARKLTQREGVELDWERIFEFCIKRDKWIEINADPMRLDLPDFLVREAVRMGVKLTLGTDSHHKDHMNNMRFGVDVARRGWASKDDIINTRSLKDVLELLRKGGDK